MGGVRVRVGGVRVRVSGVRVRVRGVRARVRGVRARVRGVRARVRAGWGCSGEGAHVTQRLVAERALLAHPLPAGDDRVLDLEQVLHADRLVDHQVGAVVVRAPRPDLLGLRLLPAVLVDEEARLGLLVHVGEDLAVLDVVGERRLRVVDAVAERARLDEEAVVLVGRLGEHRARRLGVDGLAVGDDRVGDRDGRAVHEVLRQVLEADLNVQLAAAGDDVLARLLHGALHERVRLGEPLEALDELGQVVGVLGRDGDAHDGRDGVLHGHDRVRVHRVGVGERARLDNVLVDAHDAARVTRGARVDGLGLATHHQDGALHVLHVQVLLLACSGEG